MKILEIGLPGEGHEFWITVPEGFTIKPADSSDQEGLYVHVVSGEDPETPGVDFHLVVEEKTAKVSYVCDERGSEDVLADTRAYWNKDAQEWCTNEIYDGGHVCEKCGEECKLRKILL